MCEQSYAGALLGKSLYQFPQRGCSAGQQRFCFPPTPALALPSRASQLGVLVSCHHWHNLGDTPSFSGHTGLPSRLVMLLQPPGHPPGPHGVLEAQGAVLSRGGGGATDGHRLPCNSLGTESRARGVYGLQTGTFYSPAANLCPPSHLLGAAPAPTPTCMQRRFPSAPGHGLCVHGFHFPKQTRAPCLPARGRPSPAASLTWPRQRDGFPLRAPRWERDPTWQRKRGQRRPPGSQAGAGGSLRQPIW